MASFHIVALVVTEVKDYKTGPFYIRLFLRAIVTVWNHDFIRQLPMLPMQQLEDWFSLRSLPTWPNALGLNTLKSSLNNVSRLIPEFVCQSQIIDSSVGDGGGYKNIVMEIKGDSVYSKMKWEAGVHRVQRVPATESQGRVHTSTATVAIMPECDEVDIKIDPKDIEM